MLNANELIPSHDVLFLVLDTLRFDVAQKAYEEKTIPTLSQFLPSTGWEKRHTPGSFTYAAHQAFFAGFLPTPARPGKHQRLFATHFQGSETTLVGTKVFETSNVIEGFAQSGYKTVCIGGVGFFNPGTPLGRTLPGYFQESHWSEKMGVTNTKSIDEQVALAERILESTKESQRVFLFINVSALHQPNKMYVPGATEDNVETHRAALEYVDSKLPPLFSAFKKRGPTLGLVMSDHGTCYGEDDFHGHRLAHEMVWNVPYAEFVF
jgi:Sulfatase